MPWTMQATLKGPTGAQGEPGPQGPAGPQGPPGIDATPYTDEQAQDAVGTILKEGPSIEWIYDDALPGILAHVKTQRSVSYDANGVMLHNDLTTPGASKLYGTDSAGTRGWYDQPVGVPVYTEGSYTVTATGYASAVIGTARYTQIGALVTVHLPQLSGTSNAETMMLTGLPVAIQPTSPAEQVVAVQDAGQTREGRLSLAAGSSTMTVYPNVVGNSWTTSGTKRLMPTVVSYVRL